METKFKRETVSDQMQWKLSEVSGLLAHVRDMEQPHFISSTFLLLSCQWRAYLWPWGNAKKDHEPVFAFYIALVASPRAQRQHVKISLTAGDTTTTSKLVLLEPMQELDVRLLSNHATTTTSTTATDYPQGSSKPIGFKNFMKHDEAKRCIKDDTLTLNVTIELVTVNSITFAMNAYADHVAILQKNLAEMDKDIYLVCADGTKLAANSALLKARAPVLDRLLAHNKTQTELNFKDWPAVSVRLFLDYLTTGAMPDHWQRCKVEEIVTVIDVYDISHRFDVFPLLRWASCLLSANVTLANVHRLHAFARLHEDPSLLRNIEDFARLHIRDLLKRPVS